MIIYNSQIQIAVYILYINYYYTKIYETVIAEIKRCVLVGDSHHCSADILVACVIGGRSI